MPVKKHLQKLKIYWQASTPRDQGLLALGGFLLASLVLYWLLIAPWITLQNKLDNALPRLRNDLAHIQEMVKQLAKQQALLSAQPKTGSDSQQLRSDLLSQFPPPHAALRDEGATRQHLTITQGNFDDILARLATIQQKHSIKVISSKFTRLANSTQLQAEIVLERPNQQ